MTKFQVGRYFATIDGMRLVGSTLCIAVATLALSACGSGQPSSSRPASNGGAASHSGSSSDGDGQVGNKSGSRSNRVTKCGVERWAIKTGIDRDAHLVNVRNVVNSNIQHLRSLPAQSNPPLDHRVKPTETTDFRVNAFLLRYKQEADSDFHLVIADTGGRTMIAEIPATQCVGSQSPFLPQIRYVRRVFTERFHPTEFWQRTHLPIQISGVGFFDFQHGQSGVAPNAIELHPVLGIHYGIGTPLPSASPTPPAANTGKVQVSADVSDASPPRYSRVTVYGHFKQNGHGVSGVPMDASWHFKTGTGTCSGVTNSNGTAACQRYIGRATRGYTVTIDVSFAYGGKSYSAQTQFTPR